MVQIEIITYATDARGYFNVLRSNPLVTVIGIGRPWSGFHDKIRGVLDYIRNQNLSRDSLVCFVDGFDSVMLTRNRHEMIDKFLAADADIIFSCERTSPGVLTEYVRNNIFGDCQGKPLNSGMWIGRVRDVLTFWESMFPGEDDQVFASKTCRENLLGLRIKIDFERSLFYNYSRADESSVENKRKPPLRVYTDARKFPGRVIVCTTPQRKRIGPGGFDFDYNSDSDSYLCRMPCVISAPNSENMNSLLISAGYDRDGLPNIRYPYAYHARIFFGQWAFRELWKETLMALIVFFGIVVVMGSWFARLRVQNRN